MTTYVQRNGKMVDKVTGEPMLTPEQRSAKPQVPQIMGFQAYACPVTGKPISTLEQHNANLKKHNCVEALEVNRNGVTNGEIRNERFAKKRGLTVSDRYKDEPHKWSKRETNDV